MGLKSPLIGGSFFLSMTRSKYMSNLLGIAAITVFMLISVFLIPAIRFQWKIEGLVSKLNPKVLKEDMLHGLHSIDAKETILRVVFADGAMHLLRVQTAAIATIPADLFAHVLQNSLGRPVGPFSSSEIHSWRIVDTRPTIEHKSDKRHVKLAAFLGFLKDIETLVS